MDYNKEVHMFEGCCEFWFKVMVDKIIKYDYSVSQQLFIESAFANSIIGYAQPYEIGGNLIFHNCYFNNCTFTKINTRSLIFHRCIFDNCTFDDNNITWVEFETCKINNVKMTDRSNLGSIFITTWCYRKYHIGINTCNSDLVKDLSPYSEYFPIKNIMVETDRLTYTTECYKFIHNLDIRKNRFLNDFNLSIGIDKIIKTSNKKYLFDPKYHCILVDPLIKKIPKGKIDGYKLVTFDDNNKKTYYLAKLSIPADAKRSCSIGLKCRCNKAIVTGIYPIEIHDHTDPNIGLGLGKYLPLKYYEKQIRDGEISSINDNEFVSPFSKELGKKELIYRVGTELKVSNFNDDRWIECSAGIHFFLSIKDLFTIYGDLIK